MRFAPRTKVKKEGTTVAEKDLEQSEKIGFDRILECAVILSWDELMGPSTSGLVQIEYRTDAAYSLEYLKVWSSTVRGYANLVCEYWLRPLWSHVVGLQWVTETTLQRLPRCWKARCSTKTYAPSFRIGLAQFRSARRQKGSASLR